MVIMSLRFVFSSLKYIFDAMKHEYELLSEQYHFPLTMMPWWLESVSKADGKGWDAVVVKSSDGTILGAMGFHWMRKYGVYMVLMPPMMPSVGVWFNHAHSDNVYTRRNRELRVLESLAQFFVSSRYSYVNAVFDKYLNNLLPLYWYGFQLRTRYTFVIPDISQPQIIEADYYHMKRRLIRKAYSSYRCDINTLTPEVYYDMYDEILRSRGSNGVLFTKDYFCGIAHAAIERRQGAILVISDQEGTVASALFCVWDSRTAYALSYWTKPSMLNSGSSSMMFHEAVKMLSGRVLEFDFEGSMDRGISASYSMFATKQCPMVEVIYSRGFRGWIMKKLIFFKRHLNGV